LCLSDNGEGGYNDGVLISPSLALIAYGPTYTPPNRRCFGLLFMRFVAAGICAKTDKGPSPDRDPDIA